MLLSSTQNCRNQQYIFVFTVVFTSKLAHLIPVKAVKQNIATKLAHTSRNYNTDAWTCNGFVSNTKILIN